MFMPKCMRTAADEQAEKHSCEESVEDVHFSLWIHCLFF